MTYQTIKVRFQETICFIQFHRPEANNTINDRLVDEIYQVLATCEESITVVVLEGLPEVFCFGADFQGMQKRKAHEQEVKQYPVEQNSGQHGPEKLYDLWLKLATGPYITISHVRGKANAGGIGFVASSDIVLADQTAKLSLSELIFGLFPAMVLPFLIRRIGFQRAHYMTLMTKPISIQQGHAWGLVDVYDVKSESLLRKHLLSLRRLSRTGISRYKRYMSKLNDMLIRSKSTAVDANKEIFSDTRNLEGIYRYVEKGLFPWEE